MFVLPPTGKSIFFLNGDIQRLVPGHDPLIFERHPSWITGLNKLAEINLAAGAASKSPCLRSH